MKTFQRSCWHFRNYGVISAKQHLVNVNRTNQQPNADHQAFRGRTQRRVRRLRLGFVPVNDCAPFVVAARFNLFKKYGLEVELCREKNWTEIRDRIIGGELDAAHAPGALPFAMTLGLDCAPCACVASLVTSLQGNAITLSRQLWDRRIRDATALRQQIELDRGQRTYAFGVACAHSSEYFLLQQWLQAGGIEPGRDMRIEVLPPASLLRELRMGLLDGCCISEPWTSAALTSGAGVCVASSTMLAPLHPEKVLMVTERFARERPEDHERLVAALLEACALCDQPENCEALARVLAEPEFVNAANGIESAAFDPNRRPLFGSQIFYRYKANDPTEAKAAWIGSHLLESAGDDVALRSATQPALGKVFQRRAFLAGRRLAARHLEKIELGEVNLETLARSRFWFGLKGWARRRWPSLWQPSRAGNFTASSSEARTGAGASHRSSAPRLGEREPVFCSQTTAVAGTE